MLSYGKQLIPKSKTNQASFFRFYSLPKIIHKLMNWCWKRQRLRCKRKMKWIWLKCLGIKFLGQQNYCIGLRKTTFKGISFMKNAIAFLIRWHFARQFMEKLLAGITLCFGISPDTHNNKKMSQEIHSYFHFRTMISLL